MANNGVEDVYPLSPVQQGILFHTLSAAESGVYLLQVVGSLPGKMNAAAFERAWQQVVDRHPILRTAFAWKGLDTPLQAVGSKVKLTLTQHDWRALSHHEQQSRLQEFLLSDRRQGFNISKAPLMRLNLFRLADDRYQCCWTSHHLLLDGWSMPIIFKEASAFYEAFTRGTELQLKQPRPYRDYIAWLQSQDLSAAEAYWRRTLKGFSAPTPLGIDRVSYSELLNIDDYAQQQLEFSPELSSALQRVSREKQVTLNTLMQGAWAVLLSRYSGEREVLFGTTVSGRPAQLPGVEQMVGPFINTLPVRVKVSGEQPVLEWLKELQSEQAEMRQYEHSPLVKVQGWSEMPRDVPLFESNLIFENYPTHEFNPAHYQDSREDQIDYIERDGYPLAVVCLPGRRTILQAMYFAKRFHKSSIERMLVHLSTLLEAIVANPSLRVSALPLLSAAEMDALLLSSPHCATPHSSLLPLLAEQVSNSPQAPAVRTETGTLSYLELDRRSNKLAHLLRDGVVQAESIVAVLSERSAELLIAMLGIFKAGAAYLPLDPLQPAARVGQVLRGCRARAVLVSATLRPLLEEALAGITDGPRVLLLDDVLGAVEERGIDWQTASEVVLEPQSLAYVIYTSGSTGVPKGAMVEHGGMLNHLLAKVTDLSLSAADRVAQTASQCFDISVWQYLAVLLVGGTVEIVGDETAHDPRQLLAAVREREISVLETVPSLLREMLRTDAAVQPLETLRWLLVTGEALPAELVREWHVRQAAVGVMNAYGPTECSDDVTHAVVSQLGEQEQWVVIGRAVRNTRLYVLDEQMRLVPVGVKGELYVGGDGVGRGYLGRPDLTAERFVPDAYSSAGGERLYRTGDEVRWLASGELEFIGRVDQQVKVRGYRIELGEIESILSKHEAVRECVVVAREEKGAEKQLVAYVVAKSSPSGVAAVDELTGEKVREWQEVFDQVYQQPGYSQQDESLNLRVWTSSYTGQPLAEAEIFECLEDTTSRLLALQPRRVLEIGCGTGLVLFRVAPHCEYYCGTDISAEALAKLRERLMANSDAMPEVELLQRGAENLEGIADGEFDVVVLNEVVQYFPSVEYLTRVLTEAVKKTRRGGAVFVGGVRRLELLEAFHSSVQVEQAAATESAQELRARVSKQMRQEKELVVSERLFHELTASMPDIAAVEVDLKGGRWRNELTKYRYDVVLRLQGEEDGGESPSREQQWNWNEVTDLEEIRRRLRHEQPEMVRWVGVENARLVADLEEIKLLSEAEAEQLTAQDLKVEGAQRARGRGLEPAAVREACEAAGYDVRLEWSAAVGAYDVVLKRKGIERQSSALRHASESNGHGVWKEEWAVYGNSPLRAEEKLVPELRQYLKEQLPEYMVPAAFVMLAQLPLTANGKVDRKALPAPEQHRPQLEHSFVAPRTQTEELLAGIWCEVLRLERVGVNDNFFELGGDSILSIQIVARANQAGLQLVPRDLFVHPSVAVLAQLADSRTGSESVAVAEQGVVTGSVPLTPVQQWFFEQRLAHPHHFNQSVLLEVPSEVDAALLAQVLKTLVLQHDALRMRFTRTASGWQQRHAETETVEFFSFHDLSSIPSTERAASLKTEMQKLQRSLNLTEGPLLRAALFRYAADEPQRLLLLIHHLVVDGVSWRILLEDLQRGYEQAARGEVIALGAKTSSFKQWAEQLSAYAQTAAVREQLSYWNEAANVEVTQLPRDYTGGANTVASTRSINLKLDREQTRALLQEVPGVYHTQINDVLLTALGRVLSEWSESERVAVELEGHGREEIGGGIDVTRTVGWFTSLYPLVLEMQPEAGIGAALKSVKEQLRRVPEKGIGYGLLRYMDQDSAAQLGQLKPEVSFNYLGQFGQAAAEEKRWRAAQESTVDNESGDGERELLIEVNAGVGAGQLQMHWSYSAAVHAEETIRSLAQRYIEVLAELIEHCRSAEAGGFTPSDFPEAELDQEELDELVAEFSK